MTQFKLQVVIPDQLIEQLIQGGPLQLEMGL